MPKGGTSRRPFIFNLLLMLRIALRTHFSAQDRLLRWHSVLGKVKEKECAWLRQRTGALIIKAAEDALRDTNKLCSRTVQQQPQPPPPQASLYSWSRSQSHESEVCKFRGDLSAALSCEASHISHATPSATTKFPPKGANNSVTVRSRCQPTYRASVLQRK